MSRICSGTSNIGTINSAVGGISAAPLTISLWYKAVTTTPMPGEEILVQIGVNGADTNNFTISMFSGVPYFLTNDGVSNGAASCSGAVADTNWHHICGHTASNILRTIYLDGLKKSTNTTSKTPTGINRLKIGSREAADVSTNAALAHVAIWNTNLADADVTNLAAGVSPLAVQPGNLKFYLPYMGRDATTDQSITDGNIVTYTGTSQSTNEPAIPVANPSIPYFKFVNSLVQRF